MEGGGRGEWKSERPRQRFGLPEMAFPQTQKGALMSQTNVKQVPLRNTQAQKFPVTQSGAQEKRMRDGVGTLSWGAVKKNQANIT